MKKNGWGGARKESQVIRKNHYIWCKKNGRDTSWYKRKDNKKNDKT